MDFTSLLLLLLSASLAASRNVLTKSFAPFSFKRREFFLIQATIFGVGSLALFIVNLFTFKGISTFTVLLALVYGALLVCAQWFYTIALSNGKTADSYTCLQIFIHVLKIYAVGLKNSSEFLGASNYVSNLNDLAVKCKIDDGVLVKKLNAQLKDVMKNGKTAQTIIDGLAKEVNSQINTLKTIEKTFFSLGGKAHKAGKINTFIKNGALFSAYGALGFLLEKGILDLVD